MSGGHGPPTAARAVPGSAKHGRLWPAPATSGQLGPSTMAANNRPESGPRSSSGHLDGESLHQHLVEVAAHEHPDAAVRGRRV